MVSGGFLLPDGSSQKMKIQSVKVHFDTPEKPFSEESSRPYGTPPRMQMHFGGLFSKEFDRI